jgi:hypothetical protein
MEPATLNILHLSESDFRDDPALYVELAHLWAAGGPAPTLEHEAWLRQLPRPLISKPALTRAAFWGVLAFPERARSLTWLERAGLLEEIIPSWSGDYFRQSLRLRAVDEVHLERWAVGLSKSAFDWLCVYQDQKTDGRLGGWALTGLSTLLLSGDEPAAAWALRVSKDLKALGASKGEIERVSTAIHEYPEFYQAIAADVPPTRAISPTAIVATLSTLMVIPEIPAETQARGIRFADSLLLRFAAPEQIGKQVRK